MSQKCLRNYGVEQQKSELRTVKALGLRGDPRPQLVATSEYSYLARSNHWRRGRNLSVAQISDHGTRLAPQLPEAGARVSTGSIFDSSKEYSRALNFTAKLRFRRHLFSRMCCERWCSQSK